MIRDPRPDSEITGIEFINVEIPDPKNKSETSVLFTPRPSRERVDVCRSFTFSTQNLGSGET